MVTIAIKMVSEHTYVQKCTKLDARPIFIHGTKCAITLFYSFATYF